MTSSSIDPPQHPPLQSAVPPRDTSSRRSLRIGLVISELEVGGAEKNFVNLALGLKHLGHHVFVYSLDPRPPSGRDDLAIRLEQAHIPVQFFTKSWAALPSRTQIDKLHHHFCQDGVEIANSFLFRANLALCRTERRLQLGRPQGSPLPIVLGLRQAEPRFLVRTIEKWCLRLAAASICVSRQVANHYLGRQLVTNIEELDPSKKRQILVISNGVAPPDLPRPVPHDLQALFPELATQSPNRSLPILLFMGRLAEQKGLDQLLSLTPEILRQLPGFRLAIVGQGPLDRSLQKQAANLTCADRIHFLGWRPNPLDYVQAATLVVLHSRWEGQPNAILEAMSAGKPFVTTETHGIADIFHPEQFLANPPNPAAFPPDLDLTLAKKRQVVEPDHAAAYIDAVVTLAQDQETAKNIGIWNQNHVQNHFSIQQFVSAHEQVFLKLAPPCQHPA